MPARHCSTLLSTPHIQGRCQRPSGCCRGRRGRHVVVADNLLLCRTSLLWTRLMILCCSYLPFFTRGVRTCIGRRWQGWEWEWGWKQRQKREQDEYEHTNGYVPRPRAYTVSREKNTHSYLIFLFIGIGSLVKDQTSLHRSILSQAIIIMPTSACMSILCYPKRRCDDLR